MMEDTLHIISRFLTSSKLTAINAALIDIKTSRRLKKSIVIQINVSMNESQKKEEEELNCTLFDSVAKCIKQFGVQLWMVSAVSRKSLQKIEIKKKNKQAWNRQKQSATKAAANVAEVANRPTASQKPRFENSKILLYSCSLSSFF